jgi:hypothetical protein
MGPEGVGILVKSIIKSSKLFIHYRIVRMLKRCGNNLYYNNAATGRAAAKTAQGDIR